MATKKKAAEPAVDVPSVLLSDEYNKAIARPKASLAKRWSLSRAACLTDATELAWFLVAVGRAAEARALVDQIADGVTFGGNHDLWSPASHAIALAARLARQSGDEARRARSRGRTPGTPTSAPTRPPPTARPSRPRPAT